MVRTITVLQGGERLRLPLRLRMEGGEPRRVRFPLLRQRLFRPSRTRKRLRRSRSIPGLVKGLYNVQNIVETEEIALAKGNMTLRRIVDDGRRLPRQPGSRPPWTSSLQPVYFDADVEIEDTISGFTTKKIDGKDKNVVPSKKIVGYVQVAPRGHPDHEGDPRRSGRSLQLGSIGGPIDCEIDLAGSGQKMRLNRFDFNNSVNTCAEPRLRRRRPRQRAAAQRGLVVHGQARARLPARSPRCPPT